LVSLSGLAAGLEAEHLRKIHLAAQNILRETGENESLLFADISTESLSLALRSLRDSRIYESALFEGGCPIQNEKIILINFKNDVRDLKSIVERVSEVCPGKELELIQLVGGEVPELAAPIQIRSIVVLPEKFSELLAALTKDDRECITLSNLPATALKREPLAKLKEYVPNAPDHLTIPVSFVVNKMGEALARVLDAARSANFREVLRLSDEPLQFKPQTVDNMFAQLEENRLHERISDEDMTVRHLARLLANSRDNIWRIYAGGDLLRLWSSCGRFFPHRMRLIPFQIVLRIPITEGEEMSLSKVIGFDEFAKSDPEWVVTAHVTEFDNRGRLLEFLGDFDDSPDNGRNVEEKHLVEILKTGGKIIGYTDPEEIIVFIDNSASYYYHAVKSMRQNSLSIPFSGGQNVHDIDEYLVKDPVGLAKYD
jgi:hypothetical protein